MTGQEVFELTMLLIDETSDNGKIDINSSISYKNKSVMILNSLIREIYKNNNIVKKCELNLNHPKPIKGLIKYLMHDKEDVLIEADKPCRAYSFGIKGNAKVFIDELVNGDWQELQEIEIENESDLFVQYKGKFETSEEANASRIRFTGEYFYHIENPALYDNNFFSEDEIPIYSAFIKYKLPNNFINIKNVYLQTEDQYDKLTDYKIEGNNELLINKNYSGKAIVTYIPLPKKIETLEDELDIDEITANSVLPNGLAARLMISENKSLASYFDSVFEDNKKALKIRTDTDIEKIEDVLDVSLEVNGL